MTRPQRERLRLRVAQLDATVYDLAPGEIGEATGRDPAVRALPRSADDRATGVQRYETTVDGWVFGAHWSVPPSQVSVPVAQTPFWPVLHCAPPPGLPSSTLPSQLLSKPSQTSAVGNCVGEQSRLPAVQT